MDENTLPEPSLEDSIRILLQQVPAPVRDFVLNDLGTKTEELMARYQLHVDQGGLLERELLLMLLGQETPADFVIALQDIGIDAETIHSLTSDINTEVFMKLRAAEEKTPAAPEIVRQTPPQPSIPAPTPVSMPIPPQIPPVSVPVPPISMPATASIPPVQQFVPPAPQIVQPTNVHEVRTMASDINLVKSGAFQERHDAAFVPPQPAFVPPAMPVAPVIPTPQTPFAPAPPSIPVPPPPTPSLAQQPQAIQPSSAPKAPAPQSQNREALHDILKQYGVDPYREPAE